jgi:anti-anti-sigma factor
MQIAKTNCPEGNRIQIQGSLTITAAADLKQALRELLGGSSSSIVDLSGVDECDATGIQLLRAAQKTAKNAGKRIEFLAPSAAVVDTAAALGLRAVGINAGCGNGADAL